MTDTIEKTVNHGHGGFKTRLHIKSFKHNQDMHEFLSTGDNALRWKESDKGLKRGIYAYAGGQWHNVKSLDLSILAHI